MNHLTLSAHTEINVAAGDVWEIVSNCDRDIHWREGIVSMKQSPDGPMTKGSSFHEVLTLMGQQLTTRARVLELTPRASFSWQAEEGADVAGKRSVRPVSPDSSWVELELVFHPSTFAERLFRPVFGLVLNRGLQGDVKRLKSYAEASRSK